MVSFLEEWMKFLTWLDNNKVTITVAIRERSNLLSVFLVFLPHNQ